MVKNMNIPDEIQEYVNYIAQCIKDAMPVTAIYLFGSYAKGNYRENSDLDIYVVTPDKSKRMHDWYLEAASAFERKIRMPIEILVGYEDDFERRSKWLNSVEREVVDTGVLINVL